MSNFNRRDFIKHSAASLGASAALSALPLSIRKALAIPANDATRTIRDVEHVVILMKENRSFDHYYGTLGGIRGFRVSPGGSIKDPTEPSRSALH